MRRQGARGLLAAAALLLAAAGPALASARVLVFSRTTGFRHDSIPDGIAALQAIAARRGWTLTATEDPAAFTPAGLDGYDAVVFLMTTGDVLGPGQQAALEGFVRSGGGFAGIHSAADTEYDWPWYGGLVGAYFRAHPAPQTATVQVVDRWHPSTAVLPERWSRSDEWYDFRASPRGDVHVLASLDETTYAGGLMGFDHPIAWCHAYDGGRAWYTGGGHTRVSWIEPLFLAHVEGGIDWAAGLAAGDCGATVESEYEITTLASGLGSAVDMEVAPDGRVFYLERTGRLMVYRPDLGASVAGAEFDVFTGNEDGLAGIALDPGFESNGWLYLYYSPAAGSPRQRLSRFPVTGDRLGRLGEKVLLEVPTQRDECCHTAGALRFDGDGNLFLATGDNTHPWASDGFTPIDERPGRSAFDAQKSASNGRDLRGKILRIHPEPDGTYTIPPGNLFPADGALGRPEVYVMGCRNPFRTWVDRPTGRLYFGDIGPDAYFDDAGRGPRGFDEINRTDVPGFFGWPYSIADGRPYADHDFATGETRGFFDPAVPWNDSPNNSGLRALPPALPAWIWYPYEAFPTFPELGAGSRAGMVGPLYRFDPERASDRGLPRYYDRALFLFDWARRWIKSVHLDAAGERLRIDPFLPGLDLRRPVDVEIGPDGVMYVLETGWEPDGSDARLLRIEYRRTGIAPVARAEAFPGDGPLPLVVGFSSAGSYHPEGAPFSHEWDFDLDGTVDSTDPSPVHVFSTAGEHVVRLTLRDAEGDIGRAVVRVTAGNSRPRVSFLRPALDGGIFRWGDRVPYEIEVRDVEDEAAVEGGIACAAATFQPWLVHDRHEHPLGEYRRCRGELRTDPGHGPTEDLGYRLEGRYTDVQGVARLTGVGSVRLLPSHREAEHLEEASGVEVAATLDPAGGVADLTAIDDGDWVAYPAMNLHNVSALRLRAASETGSRVEVRFGAPDGRLLGTVDVPPSGGPDVYADVVAPIDDSNQYFEVDLGAATGFDRVWLESDPVAGEEPRRFQVYVSDDGGYFRGPVARGVGVAGITDVRMAAETARFVRVILTEDAVETWSIRDLRLFRDGGRVEIDRSGWSARAFAAAAAEDPARAIDGDPGTAWRSGVPQAAGTAPLHLVFRRAPGDASLLRLNWLELEGAGMAADRAIPGEPSGPGSRQPLRAVKTPGGEVLIAVENVTGETGYVVYENEIGTWYGTPVRTCVPVWSDAGELALVEHGPAAGNRWFVVAAASSRGESTCGSAPDLTPLERLPGWPATGPCP